MQNYTTNHGRTRFRRRIAALAVASALATAGTVQAFEIPLDNPDLAVRWDNTVRYNLGARAQSQDSAILAAPNYDDGDRNFSNGSLVTNRVDLFPSSTWSGSASSASARATRRGTTSRTRASTTHRRRRRTRWSTACRSPARSPRTRSVMPRASPANGSTRSSSPMSTRAMCPSTPRSANTRSIGAIACSWAARSTASRIRRTRSMSGRVSRRRAAKRRNCSGPAAASHCRRSRSRSCR